MAVRISRLDPVPPADCARRPYRVRRRAGYHLGPDCSAESPPTLPTRHEPIAGQTILQILSAHVGTVRGSHRHRGEPPVLDRFPSPVSTGAHYRRTVFLHPRDHRDPRPSSTAAIGLQAPAQRLPTAPAPAGNSGRTSSGQPTGGKREMPPVRSPDPAFRDQGAGQRHGLPARRRSGLSRAVRRARRSVDVLRLRSTAGRTPPDCRPGRTREPAQPAGRCCVCPG